MKSRANYKEYIIDVILILFVVQLARINIKFILLKKIGKAYIDTTVTDEEMKEAAKFLMMELED